MSDIEQDEYSMDNEDRLDWAEPVLSDSEFGAVGGSSPRSKPRSNTDPNPFPDVVDRVYIGVNLYLRQLSPETTAGDLVAILCQFGKLTHMKLITDHNGKSRGIAFVHFETEQAAVFAQSRLHNQILGERKIQAEMVRTDHGIALQVSNLDPKIGKGKLNQFFDEFGRITETSIFPNTFGVYRMGTVHYKDPNEAIDAMIAMHRVHLLSNAISVDIAPLTKPAQPAIVPTLIPTPMGLVPGPWIQVRNSPPAPNLPAPRLKKTKTKKNKFNKFQEVLDEDYVPEPLTLEALKGKSWQRQKLMFGERLFPLVEKWHRKHVDPIVSLLIFKSNEDLFKMLEDETYLKDNVDEAYLIFKRLFIYRTNISC